MTITPTRLRELIRFADDLGADIDQEYRAMQNFREIAAALRESTTMIAELDGYAASDRIKSENLRLADTELAALRDVRETLRRECEALKAERAELIEDVEAMQRTNNDLAEENERLLRALNAALGVGGDFPMRTDGDPPYWWRNWLQEFAGLEYNGSRFVSKGRAALNATTGE